METQETAQESRAWWRRRGWLASAVSGLVGALALATSTYDVYLQRQQVRAQVWPRLVLDTKFDGTSFVLGFVNRGVGPAEVKRVRATVDGQPCGDWLEAEVRLLKKTHLQFGSIESLENAVLAPNEPLDTLTIMDPSEAMGMMAERARITYEVCYCSSLDECWTLTAAGRSPQVTRPVPGCAPDAVPFQSLTDEDLDRVIGGIAALHARGSSADSGSPDDARAR